VKKSSFRHKAPAPPADQDRAWADVVRALRTPGDDSDLPDADDLPDAPEGHLAFGLKGAAHDPRS
jgi:hypothetical protein